ncbi:MAG: hypothetical protein ACU841_04145 [Gammaproteobacteria bacterium]
MPKQTNIFRIAALILGISGLFALLGLDKIYFGKSILAEGRPDFSLAHGLRSSAVFLSVFAVVHALAGNKKPALKLIESSGFSIECAGLSLTFTASLAFLFLFLFSPSEFSALSLEDGMVEWGSALLLLACCILFSLAFFKSRGFPENSAAARWTLVLLAIAFFVMAMEEVSWLQRVFDIKTPELLDNLNQQSEMNLHNLKTGYFENLFYFGSFLYLLGFPFLRVIYPLPSHQDFLKLFMPRPFVAVSGSVACAYNFDMWNILFTQIAFFGALLILWVFALYSRDKKEKFILLTALLLVAVTQVLFLTLGEGFSRLWDVTEYKEFLIPLAFFFYSLDVFTGIGRVYDPGVRSTSHFG